jgi:hypothetical protein
MNHSLKPIWLVLIITISSIACFAQKGGKHTKQIVKYADTCSKHNDFKYVQSKYDTLIPCMNGLFITYDTFDYRQYYHLLGMDSFVVKEEEAAKLSVNNYATEYLFGDFRINCKKWGLIDSTNRVIIPFICDGIAQTGQDSGVFSLYKFSFSLNTGIPRYSYNGYYYQFNKKGEFVNSLNPFEITVVFISDFHNTNFVISQGPGFYLPDSYRKNERK